MPLLQLPRGFSYRSFGWSGDRMDDGQPCPDRHDGMAVVGLRRPDWRPGSDPLRTLEYVLTRNHERAAGQPVPRTGHVRHRHRQPAGRSVVSVRPRSAGRWPAVVVALVAGRPLRWPLCGCLYGCIDKTAMPDAPDVAPGIAQVACGIGRFPPVGECVPVRTRARRACRSWRPAI
ncbi:alkaline phosphatase PhoX [Xanthomonas nasturtii]|uniref:alkaline phosphatase PhoX n=1 Tax=Xanthomonas nasturtii TaxID=1843581 RepID=UPI003CE4A10F